jgi:diaminobutyrate-2-oxoglutarate transaminase
LLIVDEVQTGCCRTGPFFSFERAGIVPDIVCLAKSISGLGLPMALVLIKREHDAWSPGEHNGTFRGSNLSFVTATAALELWSDDKVRAGAASVASRLQHWCELTAQRFGIESKGLGAMRGLAFCDPAMAESLAAKAFERGVLVERCGSEDQVVKLMPPLTMEPRVLEEGLQRLTLALESLQHATVKVLRQRTCH